jgi:dTDP-glucose 4,6-dehydratase
MRVLVSGVAGFLASHLADALIEQGHRVIGVDNLSTGFLENLDHLRYESRFTFEERNICEAFDPGEVDAVYNFASPASPIEYMQLGIETLRVGSQGTTNLLDIAEKYQARFLLASTSECYGDPLEHPQSESYWGHVNPVGPRSVYDEAKRYAEAITMAYHRYRRLDTRIVRIFNTYGPRLHAGDGRVISNFLTQALNGQPLTIYGDGSQTRSFCYVGDLIAGILALAASDENMPVNLGNPEELTILECARAVLEVTGAKSELVYQNLPVDDPTRRKPDITKARTTLGWEPKVTLDEGLRRSAAYFQEQIDRQLLKDVGTGEFRTGQN